MKIFSTFIRYLQYSYFFVGALLLILDFLLYFNIGIETIVEFFKNLDTTNFQNIILGILTIYIPFVIPFFTNTDDKKNPEYKRYVFQEEVLLIKWLFLVSVFSLFLFSIDTSNIYWNVFCCIFLVPALFFFYQNFQKVLRFSRGEIDEFLYPALQNLSGKKEQYKVWKSFLEQYENLSYMDSRKYLDELINQIDIEIKVSEKLYQEKKYSEHNRYGHRSGGLIEIIIDYSDNLPPNYLEYYLFPQIYKWSNETIFQDSRIYEPFITTILNKKKISFSALLCELQKVVHENSNNETNKNFFFLFCPIFLDAVYKKELNNNSHNIWLESSFDPQWKITSENLSQDENIISRLFLKFFLFGIKKYIETPPKSFDYNIDRVINNLFPQIDSYIFSRFLKLLFDFDTTSLVTKPVNFGSGGGSDSVFFIDDDVDIEKQEMELVQKKKKATIKLIRKIIYNFTFEISRPISGETINISHGSHPLFVDNLKGLKDLKKELESAKVKEFCKKDETYESRRSSFIRFINWLLKEFHKLKHKRRALKKRLCLRRRKKSS